MERWNKRMKGKRGEWKKETTWTMKVENVTAEKVNKT
jgi:hypothetical protein